MLMKRVLLLFPQQFLQVFQLLIHVLRQVVAVQTHLAENVVTIGNSFAE